MKHSRTPSCPNHAFLSILALSAALVVSGGASAEEKKEEGKKTIPPAAAKQVDYARDIEPILTKHCLKCHGPNKPKNDFRLDERELALKGGESGLAILPGKSAESPLIQFVSAIDEDMRMPPTGQLLSAEQVGLLRAWIDQGVVWADVKKAAIPPRTDIAGIEGAKSWVTSVAFAPGGDVLATGGGNTLIFKPGEVKLWDLSTGKERKSFEGHGSTVWSVAIDPRGKTLASASYDKLVKLWDIEGSKEIATLKGHTNWITSVAFSHDGELLATASEDATVKIWKAASGEEVGTLKGHGATVRCVAFSPDKTLIATGSFDKTVKLWDVAKMAERETLSGHEDAVWSVVFAKTSGVLASAGADGTVKLWAIGKDGAKSEAKSTIQAHGNWVTCVAFSPDGKRFATTGFDRSVRLWDTEKGQEIDAVGELEMTPWSAAFSPDGKRLALGLSAGPDGEKTLRIWSLIPEGVRAF